MSTTPADRPRRNEGPDRGEARTVCGPDRRLRGVMAEGAAPSGPEAASLDRIATVPNLITAVRLACVPLFLWLLFGAHRQTDAAILLAVLGATDWIDGFVARRFAQVSTLGKVLDPVADRIL